MTMTVPCEPTLEELRRKIEEYEETLRAIRSGEVDALVVGGPQGDNIYTLKNAEQPYRVLVESMNEGAVTLAADGTILYGNARFAEILETDLDQLLGTRVSACVEGGCEEACNRLLSPDGHSKAEVTFRTFQGRTLPVYISSRTLPPESGGDVCWVVTDLTELKRAQQKLSSAEAELQDARRLADIGLLSAMVAHELRNPLAAIAIASKNLETKAGSETGVTPQERQFQTIRRKITECDQIINNLLFYSKLRKSNPNPMDLSQTLQECAELARQRHPGVEIRLQLPDAAAIQADALQMEELFCNLLNNACEASGPGGHVTVTAAWEGQALAVTVADSGIGMNDQQRARCLEPFFTTKSKGTGLGLTVAHQIVKLHQGRLEIASRPGSGTQVTVRLPGGKA